MTKHYTNSQGLAVEIAAMAYPHLTAAHAKAVKEYDYKAQVCAASDETYSNPKREAEIKALAEEIARRDDAYGKGEANGPAS